MEPRRKTNKKIKSTSLPAEYVKNVKAAFTEAFKPRLGKREIFVEGRMFPEELILCVGYLPDPKGLRQMNFEASVDHSGKDVFEKLSICVDALSSMMDQFLDNEEDMELPLEWTPFDFDKTKVYMRTSGRNTVLENEANKILGVDPNDALYTDENDPLNEVETGDENTAETDEDYEETMKQVDEKLKKKKDDLH